MIAVTFKQAHRRLRMAIEDREWSGLPIGPNSLTTLQYYQERIDAGGSELTAYFHNGIDPKPTGAY